LATREGLVLAGVFYLLSATGGVVSALLVPTPAAPGAGGGLSGGVGAGQPPTPEAFVPALGATLVVSVLTTLATVVFVVGTLRIFVEERPISADPFVRNLPLAFLNYVLGGVVYAVLVLVGLLFLVVPGVFLMIVLAFWTVFVAVEDENFVSAFAESWRLTRGNRLRILGLGVVAVVLSIVISIPFSAVSGAIGFLAGGGTVARSVGALVGAAGSALTTIITLGIVAAAYRQLDHESEPETGTNTEAPRSEGV
jgi:hypothetical protein